MKTSTRARERNASRAIGLGDLAVRPSRRVKRRFEVQLTPGERAALRRLGRVGARTGIRLYLVGGVVRDLLLGRPVRDLDVAVEGEVRTVIRRLGGTVRTHPGFGTATVRLRDGLQIDLVRTRRERYPRPAALPKVEPAGLAEDLARRDFTVNAMASPLGAGGPAGLIDPFGGLDDLRRKRVRVLHGRSFLDDPTRAFRGARLAAELGFEIGPGTSRLIRSALRTGVFERLSSARLRREIVRALEARRPGRAVRLLSRHGLLGTLDPELRAPRGIVTTLGRLPVLVARHSRCCPDEALTDWAVVLALLLRQAEAEVIERTLARLQPSRAARRAVCDGIDALRTLPRALARGRGQRASAIYTACRRRTTEALLGVATATSSATVRRAVLKYLHSLRGVRLEITGRDLLQHGIGPGPAVARGLEAALSARLDGRAPSRDRQLGAALAAARRS
jgi:tRNA nucleotidyltransferase (CCA-adding enzyme)